jgi:hypothetical protein
MKYLFFLTLFPISILANEDYEAGKQLAKGDLLSQLNSVIYYSSTSLEYMEQHDMKDCRYFQMQGRLHVYEEVKNFVLTSDF